MKTALIALLLTLSFFASTLTSAATKKPVSGAKNATKPKKPKVVPHPSVDARIPVIAVMSQPATTYNSRFPGATNNWSQVVGSYVDWVQQTGAEAALIPYDMPWHILTQVLSQTQGMVLPGGAAELVDEHKGNAVTNYQLRIHEILKWVENQNNNGNYYPVWGTCLGMEELMIHFGKNNGKVLQGGFNDNGKYHPVDLKPEFWKSKFFGNLNVSKKDLKAVFGNPIAYYYHSEGVDVAHFKKMAGMEDVRLLATSKNEAKREFTAILESKKYPFYFTQFHPEKHQFEKRDSYKPMDRSERTIKVMTSFVFKLVELARPHSVTFEKIPQSVQSYFPYYKTPTWSPSKAFERIYMFKNYFGLPDLQPHTASTATPHVPSKSANTVPKKINKLRKLLGQIGKGNKRIRRN